MKNKIILALSAALFIAAVFTGCAKKSVEVIVFDNTHPLALAPDVEWAVVTEPYAVFRETAPINVAAEFFAIDPNRQVGDKREGQLVYESDEQYIRTKFTDYDIIRVDVILSAGGYEKELSAEVKR